MSIIGYYCINNFGGVKILDILNDDKVICQWFEEKPKKVKLYENSKGNVYFKINGIRYYLEWFTAVKDV